MANVTYRHCSRCVMDTSDPEISFDNNGYCNHCITYLENRKKKKFSLDNRREKTSINNKKNKT